MRRNASSQKLSEAVSLSLNACPNNVTVHEYDTPRDADELASLPMPSYARMPQSPAMERKTKSRAGRGLYRNSSLRESKVLMVADLRRTDSTVQPDLFQYHSHFDFLGLIGKTQVSEVFRVRHRQTGEIFAVKRSRRRFCSKLQRERCLREIRAVAALPPHSNVVAQHRAWQEGGHFYIQMSYCEGGSLLDLVQQSAHSGVPLADVQLWAVARDIGTGLAFLHAYGILHLDIKPENLYCKLDTSGIPAAWCIGDFGLAVAKETDDWEEGDGDYVAPELLAAGCDPTYAADIFSLGATLYECATGEKLPRKEGSAQAAEIELPGRPTEMLALIRSMLHPDAATRPTAEQVLAFIDPGSASIQQRTPEVTHAAAQQNGRSPGCHAGANQRSEPSADPASRGGDGATAKPAAHLPSVTNMLMPKWAPSLSPLISEGGATPSAAAGLMGLTPPTGNEAPVQEARLGPFDQTKQIPPSLSLPTFTRQPVSARTADNLSFRLHRRDVLSPARDMQGSASESEAYSFSCTTTGSASDLDLADMLSPGAGKVRFGRATMQGVPVRNDCRGASQSGLLGPSMPTSPDFVLHGPSGSPNGMESSDAAPPRGAWSSANGTPVGQVSSRSYSGVPAFPRLDKDAATPMSSPNNASGQDPLAEQLVATASRAPIAIAMPKIRGPGGAPVPPLALAGAMRRKRHHSSRRTLAQTLREGDLASSRSVEICSSRSVELLMPQKKGARHAYDVDPHDGDDDANGNSPPHSPMTQRSSRGPPTARMAELLEHHASTDIAMEASVVANAAAHINNMSLDDPYTDA